MLALSVASFVLCVLNRVNSRAIGKQLPQTVDQSKSEEYCQCCLHIHVWEKSMVAKMPTTFVGVRSVLSRRSSTLLDLVENPWRLSAHWLMTIFWILEVLAVQASLPPIDGKKDGQFLSELANEWWLCHWHCSDSLRARRYSILQSDVYTPLFLVPIVIFESSLFSLRIPYYNLQDMERGGVHWLRDNFIFSSCMCAVSTVQSSLLANLLA